MDFATSLQQLQQQEGLSHSFQVPAGWGQGRALFGGLAAAMALQYVLPLIAEGMQLRSMTVSFVAPLVAGEAKAERRILRQGKSVVQAQVELWQEGQVALVLLASFGVARVSEVFLAAATGPVATDQPDGMVLPDGAAVPEFTQHFDYRISQGGLPFSGVKSIDFGGCMRFRQPFSNSQPERAQQPADLMQLVALIDAWPPATLPWLSRPAPASSLCWTLEFLTGELNAAASDWWSYLAHIDTAADGYGHIGARIWDKNGTLVAISRQTVTLFG